MNKIDNIERNYNDKLYYPLIYTYIINRSYRQKIMNQEIWWRFIHDVWFAIKRNLKKELESWMNTII